MARKVFSKKQAVSALEKLGLKRSNATHHIRGFLIDPKGIKLFPPLSVNKGSGDLPPRIQRKLQKGLRLDDSEFNELFRCSMKKNEYFKIRESRE